MSGSRSRAMAAATTIVLLAVGLLPARAQAGCSWWNAWRCYTETRYPIVLAHGLLGFDSLGSFLEYFHGIPSALERGGAEVYVTVVSQANASTVRGEQIIAQLEELRAITGHPKFNLVGHSQGGLDVRYVASVRPDLVASVTTVATPHQGIPGIGSLLDDGFTGSLAAGFVESLGGAIELLTGAGLPLDGDAAIREFTAAGIAQFNTSHPQGLPVTECGEGAPVVNGIRYYSWSGASPLTNALDLTDVFFAVSDWMVDGRSDGFVEQCSSHLGDVIRDDYRQNHLDEVNQLLGLVSVFEHSPVALFRAHANRLKNAGL